MTGGEQENRRSGQEDQARDDHCSNHKLGAGAALYFLRSMQPDPITVGQLHRIELQGYLAPNSQKVPAFNSSDRTTGHCSSLNDGEASNAHISHDNKIQGVSNAGMGRRNAFGESEFDRSAVWNY